MREIDDDLFDACLEGEAIDRLGREFIIIEHPQMKNGGTDFPIRSSTAMSVVVLGGAMECRVDMAIHRIDVPGMLIVLPSQIVEKVAFSSDFRGYCIIMSSSFLENMPMGHKVPVMLEVRQTGFYAMTTQMLEVVENYAKMVQATLRTERNNWKTEIVTHLTIAYYYGLGTYIHQTSMVRRTGDRYGEIADQFVELVRENCHMHRDMDFYADALCLSAKHVNLAVKKITGDNAMKWIERYTVLKAKSMLKTTCLPISEIAYRLNFQSPGDFGKYFKKFTGYAPKEYRRTECLVES